MATEIKVPALGESVNEATVARWLKKAGEAVALDDPLVELETDKVTLEVNAPAAGTLSEIVVPEGANVAVGAVLGRIGDGAASATTAPAPKPQAVAAAASSASASATASAGTTVLDRSGPAVRKLVEEQKLDPAAITVSGKDGRITKGDVLTQMAQPKPAPAAAKPAPPPAPAAPPRSTGPREERVRMSRLAPPHRRAPQGGAEQRRHAHHLQRGGYERGDGAARALSRELREEARRAPRLHVALRQGVDRRAEGDSRRSTPRSPART